MYQYLNLITDILEHGVEQADRTATGTLSVFGRQLRFDLAQGFPLVTTKRLHVKSIIHELLFFLSAASNIQYLQEHGVSIWNPWADEDNSIGKAYGYQWRAWEGSPQPLKITPRRRLKPKTHFNYLQFPLEVPDKSNSDTLIGRTFDSHCCGQFRVLAGDNHGYRIQFLTTGYQLPGISHEQMRQGSVTDIYYPIEYGVGFVGEQAIKTALDNQLYQCWRELLARCYHPKHPQYHHHLQEQAFVEPRWFNFSHFYADAKSLPNWGLFINDPHHYQLSKDYYHSNCYSAQSCVWLSQAHVNFYKNNILGAFKVFGTAHSKPFIELSPAVIAENYQLDINDIKAALKGQKSSVNGFRFEPLVDGDLYRYPLAIDQISQLIDGIQTQPYSRRHIVSAWNVAHLEAMALPPCHLLMQFYVAHNKLSCQLYMRSADVGIGLPFNIASYALLTLMIAQVCNLAVGELIVTLGDAHIYRNHIQALKIQQQRQPYELPTMKLNKTIKDIFSFKYNDFTLENYQAHPHIKMPVAV